MIESSYLVRVWYPDPKDPFYPKSFYYWKVRVENCVQAKTMSFMYDEKQKFIDMIIDGKSTLVKFLKSLHLLFPTSIVSWKPWHLEMNI
jgi:hypothetical protein